MVISVHNEHITKDKLNGFNCTDDDVIIADVTQEDAVSLFKGSFTCNVISNRI